jgi:PAS domain S-box-containing protein
MKERRKILLIEDFAAKRQIYRSYLAQDCLYDYEIREAATLEAALGIHSTLNPDLVLLKEYLAPGSALDFLACLQMLHPTSCAPILLLCDGETATTEQALSLGVTDYLLTRQLTPTYLSHRIRQTLKYRDKRQKSETLHLALDFAQIGYWEWLPQAEKIFASEHTLKILGLSLDNELTYPIWRDLVHAEDIDRIETQLNEAISTGKPHEVEYRIIWPDGSLHWVVTKGRASYDAQGQFHRMIGIKLDITRRKQSENAIRYLATGCNVQTDADFFSSLLAYLANALDIDFALIGKFDPSNQTITTLAIYGDGQPQPNFSYPISATPCEQIIQIGYAFYPSQVQKYFPEDKLLCQLQLESYIGIPLYHSDSSILGIIAVLNRSPLPDYQMIVETLKICASRAAAELERQAILEDLENRVQRRTRQRDEMIAKLNKEIEEKKKIELTLQEKQKFIQSIADNSPSILYIYDIQEQRTVYVNRQILTTLGYSEIEANIYLTNPIDSLVHPEDKILVNEHIKNLENLPDGEISEVEYRLQDKQGKWHCLISYNSIFQRDEQENVKQIIGTAQDVTERYEARKAIQESEERYRQLFNLVPYGIQENDLTGTITITNPAYDRIFCCATGERIGTKIWHSIVSDADKIALQEYIAYLAQEQPIPAPHTSKNYTYNGRIIDVQVDWTYKRNEQGKVVGFVSIISDVTARVQAEQEMQRALEIERELSQLKSQFIDVASHEFRTPLTTIIGSIQFILKRYGELADSKKQEHLFRAYEAATQLKQLMENILEVRRTEAHKLHVNPVAVNLESFCRDLLHEVTVATGTQHLFLLEFAAITDVLVDIKLLYHILNNLLVNAAKYSPCGSQITLSVTCVEKELIFSVTDQGIGIPPEDQAHIFECFHRGNNVGDIPGTGLGLHIVKQYLSLLDGKIEVVSTVGQGSTFCAIIPYHLPES